jgi:ribosome-associated protein
MQTLRATMPETRPFALRGEHITLDALLKASGVAGSGGEAKVRVAAGDVAVNGETEQRRGRKLRAGDVVEVDGLRIEVQAG